LAAANPARAKAPTVWTGASISYSQPGTDPSQPANQDPITPIVVFTRAATLGLFNAAAETNYTHNFSPAGTEWAFGNLANYASLAYTNWETWTSANPPSTIGQNAVVHLITQDIYIGIQFTSWPSHGAGGFAYTRTTPPPPNIWNGQTLTFTQPASDPAQASNQDRLLPGVWLTRAASKGLFNAAMETAAGGASPLDTEWAFGTLDNYASLTFQNWSNWLNGASPVTLIGKPAVVHLISENTYLSIEITAWAAHGAGGFSYERSTPPGTVFSITNSPPSLAAGRLSFTYSTTPNRSYVVEVSTNLPNWTPAATNAATSNSAAFSDFINLSRSQFYRVKLAP